VSFSNEDGVEVLDLDPNYGDGDNDDDDYLTRLLDFLSKSFEGGGTDVTGALKRALEYLEEVGGDAEAADLLLVTDGEIPDPPFNEGNGGSAAVVDHKTRSGDSRTFCGRARERTVGKTVHARSRLFDGVRRLRRCGTVGRKS